MLDSIRLDDRVPVRILEEEWVAERRP